MARVSSSTSHVLDNVHAMTSVCWHIGGKGGKGVAKKCSLCHKVGHKRNSCPLQREDGGAVGDVNGADSDKDDDGGDGETNDGEAKEDEENNDAETKDGEPSDVGASDLPKTFNLAPQVVQVVEETGAHLGGMFVEQWFRNEVVRFKLTPAVSVSIGENKRIELTRAEATVVGEEPTRQASKKSRRLNERSNIMMYTPIT